MQMIENNWRVISFAVSGKRYWFVYKLKSVCTPDETGNRIYKGGQFQNERDAQEYADRLNVFGNEIKK